MIGTANSHLLRVLGRGRGASRTPYLDVFMCSVVVGAMLSGMLLGGAPAQAATTSAQLKTVNGSFLTNLPAPAAGAAGVCMIDTGINPEQTPGTVVQHAQTLDGDTGSAATRDTVGHGTNTTQALTQTWPSVPTTHIKTGNTTTLSATQYMQALNACIEIANDYGHNTSVINLSFGLEETTSDELRSAQVQTSLFSGYDVNFVAAAGNDGSSTVSYPAGFDGVLAVGASDSGTGGFCSFSNRGTGLDISAPGCGIQVFDENGIDQGLQGTSFSAPIVSSVLAALRSYRPDLSASEAESLLLASAATTSAGRVVDVETLFRTAGLGSLVDQYRPTEEETNSNNGGVNSSFNTEGAFEVVELNKPRVKSKKMRGRKVTIKLASTPMPGSTLHIKSSGINKKIDVAKIRQKTITLSLVKKPKKTLKLRLRFTHPEFYATDWVTVKIKARR